jgi:2-polyprenyl-6-hydroxyphenyl methylase/3-demethylubiquinone-9 3-methyltransferase
VTTYYAERLSGRRLQQCYELASPRVQQYLECEILHVLSRLRPDDTVLELGCGYGRVALRLAERADRVVGIDVSEESLALARELAGETARCEFLLMDATDMTFDDASFDAVVCVQNGVCAFGVVPADLLREALRVTKPLGRVLLSTYADAFWPDRLAWFEDQAAAGLVGAIDRVATRRGEIVCEDGFTAGALAPDELAALCASVGVVGEISEVDRSSVFCEIVKPRDG